MIFFSKSLTLWCFPVFKELIKLFFFCFDLKRYSHSDVFHRFAFSVIWEINRNAEILSTKFHKSIIKSKAALTYAEAQIRIDDEHQQDAVTKGLRRLNMLAKILKKERIKNGLVQFNSIVDFLEICFLFISSLKSNEN